MTLFINANTKNPQMKGFLCSKEDVQTQLIKFADQKQNNCKCN